MGVGRPRDLDSNRSVIKSQFKQLTRCKIWGKIMYLLKHMWKVRIDKITYLKQSKFVEKNIVSLALDDSFFSVLSYIL